MLLQFYCQYVHSSPYIFADLTYLRYEVQNHNKLFKPEKTKVRQNVLCSLFQMKFWSHAQ